MRQLLWSNLISESLLQDLQMAATSLLCTFNDIYIYTHIHIHYIYIFIIYRRYMFILYIFTVPFYWMDSGSASTNTYSRAQIPLIQHTGVVALSPSKDDSLSRGSCEAMLFPPLNIEKHSLRSKELRFFGSLLLDFFLSKKCYWKLNISREVMNIYQGSDASRSFTDCNLNLAKSFNLRSCRFRFMFEWIVMCYHCHPEMAILLTRSLTLPSSCLGLLTCWGPCQGLNHLFGLCLCKLYFLLQAHRQS